MQLSVTGAELIVKVRGAGRVPVVPDFKLNAAQGIALSALIGAALWIPVVVGIWLLLA